MKKKNCWDHMQCGRSPGEQKSSSADVCPATVHKQLHGIHGGENAGRACWAIDDSLCPKVLKETAAKKFEGCWKCDFYHLVKHEERSSPHGFISTYREMIKMLSDIK